MSNFDRTLVEIKIKLQNPEEFMRYSLHLHGERIFVASVRFSDGTVVEDQKPLSMSKDDGLAMVERMMEIMTAELMRFLKREHELKTQPRLSLLEMSEDIGVLLKPRRRPKQAEDNWIEE